MHDLGTTLVALASPSGRGGVACVKLSGPRAEDIAARLFAGAPGHPAGGVRPMQFGRFLSRDGTPIDHGYRVIFPPEHSFTGETAVELWPHGSPAVVAELVAGAVAAGATPAGPGELTYRAVRHGRLDLARAEAIRDLVAARTLVQARVAFRQLGGALSRRLAPVREALLDLAARVEAAVEFVEEAETHLPPGLLAAGLAGARADLEQVLCSFESGRVLREGATVALTGRPNVGKSSLFNRLLGRDRAIVAERPGTTRDTLEEMLDLDGLPIVLVDGAGHREAADPVEAEGVRRARQAEAESDLVLRILDASRPLDPREAACGMDDPRVLVVVNKADLPPSPAGPPPSVGLRVSAVTGAGVPELRGELRRRLAASGPLEDPILTDARHAGAIGRAVAALREAESAVARGLSEEFALDDLATARAALGEIAGEDGTEALYDRIFSTFCLGK